MYKNILAAVDLAHSDTAKRTVSVAKSLVGANGIKLTLLNVVPGLPGYVAVELNDSILDKMHATAEAELKDLVVDTELGETCHQMLRAGRPHNEILQVADEIGADLIVISSHQPGFEDYLLGSVAGRVVRHAKCSVLVARQPKV